MQATTPLMRQYYEIKQKFPDALVLFQVGDFYELFFEDAKKAAAFLGIALTKRGKNNGEPIPLCGVPVHALDHYITKLIRGGFKVALCDQLTEPQPGKVVERGVTRVFTPGTLTETALLDEKKSSYLFSFFPLQDSAGLLFGELLTAQLYATVIPVTHSALLEAELIRFFPDEVLVPSTKLGKNYQSYFKQLGYFTSTIDFDVENEQESDAVGQWLGNFKTESRDIVAHHEAVRRALYNFFAYLRTTQETSLAQFNHLQLYQTDDFLILDAATQRNLELIKNNQDGGRQGTLLSTLDGAATAMGSRMIKKWLMRPLVKQEPIVQRQDAVQALLGDVVMMQTLTGLLVQSGDCERMIGRIALHRASVRDYCMLMQTLSVVPLIKEILGNRKDIPLLALIAEHCHDFSSLHELLQRALNTDETKDWIIKEGFDSRLDHMRELVFSGNQKIIDVEQAEQQATGIGSLKIRYNNVHGYSIEITKTHYHAVPAHYIRRQTLVGRERFTTPELQALEHEIVQARAEIATVEQEVFATIKRSVTTYVVALRKMVHALAHLDALLGFACVAYNHGYTRPAITQDHDIRIKEGRHPVVERTIQNSFIPNDTVLTDEQSLWIITGPNMGGKSTYLRQVALLSIMAQCGSFVPARAAQLPLLDRIFTRIGSGDNLVGGKSTFMVEMEETALICTHATKNSLVILDEVGRGTSTFDGLALAQAVVEYIYHHIKARCLFATHYHELTNLENTFSGVVSYYAASTKTSNGIIFLYKMVRGVADGSFGIEVAKLADLPKPVIIRAQELVHQLTQGVEQVPVQGAFRDEELSDRLRQVEAQLRSQAPIIATLKALDYDALSPKQALDLLWKLKENGL